MESLIQVYPFWPKNLCKISHHVQLVVIFLFVFYQEDEEEPEDDQEGEEVKDLGLQVRGVSLTPRQDQKVNV